MKISELKSLNRFAWFLILGTMLSKGSYFISMPFLALRMKSALSMDPLMIGLTLGLGPLIGIIAGFYMGHLSDHWGRKAIFTTSIFVWSLTFLGFSVATEFWHFAFLNMLNGLCNSINQPVSAAMISDFTENSLRKTAYHLRYYAINLGASFGPLLGAWLLLQDASLGFLLTAVIYFIYGMACIFRLPQDSVKNRGSAETPRASFGQTLKVLSEDKPLMFYTLATVFMGMTYSQLESTLPQFLESKLAHEGVKLFGILSAMNALTVVVSQVPLNRFMSKFSLITTIQIGCFVYGVGLSFLGMIQFGMWALIAAMVVLTLGEILIFSNGSILIDQIAPEDKKGAYFGASGLWSVGSMVGPGIGGYLLMRTSGQILYLILGIIGALNVLLYRMGHAAQLRKNLNTKT